MTAVPKDCGPFALRRSFGMISCGGAESYARLTQKTSLRPSQTGPSLLVRGEISSTARADIQLAADWVLVQRCGI